jgi:hypothetical protein
MEATLSLLIMLGLLVVEDAAAVDDVMLVERGTNATESSRHLLLQNCCADRCPKVLIPDRQSQRVLAFSQVASEQPHGGGRLSVCGA